MRTETVTAFSPVSIVGFVDVPGSQFAQFNLRFTVADMLGVPLAFAGLITQMD